MCAAATGPRPSHEADVTLITVPYPSSLDSLAVMAARRAAALAQGAAGYPSKPIHIAVTFTTGGAPDILARLIGEKLKRPGASRS